MKTLIPIILLFAIMGCSGLTITENDQRAMDTVAQLSDGIFQFSKGYHSNYGIGPDSGTEYYFEITLSNSQEVEKNLDYVGILASGLAYEFYANLGEGQQDYNQIIIKINLAKGETPEWSFSTEELAEIVELRSMIDTVTELIKAQDYEGLSAQFHTEPDPEPSSDELETICARVDSTYGEVEQTEFIGFNFHQAEGDYRSYALLYGTMEREEVNTAFTLVVNRYNQKIAGLRFYY